MNCRLRTLSLSGRKMATLRWILQFGKGFHEISASFWTKKKVDDCYLIRQHISLHGSMQYADGERERVFIAQQLMWLKETAKSIRRKTSYS